MGTIFNSMHFRLVSSLGDTNRSDSTAIALATTDGKKRTSAQRDRDLNDARYFVHSILRIVDREMYHGIRPSISFDANGYLDVSGYAVTNHEAINLLETSAAYGKPVPVVRGEELPLHRRFLATFKKRDLIAGVVVDHSATSQTTRLRLLKGADVVSALSAFVFDIGYYAGAVLRELEATTGVTTGTGTLSSSGAVVTGVGTAFLTELVPGSVILSDSLTRTVVSISSNTAMVVDSAPSPAWATDAFTITSEPDVTEARLWHPIIEGYALYLAFQGSQNFARAQKVFAQVKDQTITLVANEYGSVARGIVTEYLSKYAGSRQ